MALSPSSWSLRIGVTAATEELARRLWLEAADAWRASLASEDAPC